MIDMNNLKEIQIEDLKCCGNCEKFYECNKPIVENKMGKGYCKKWESDSMTQKERM